MKMHRQYMEFVSDEALLREYLRTDDPAYFGELYARYIPQVYGLCLKYLKSPENAEDAVMQLFEELTYKVKQYEITHFKSWLYRVAQNHCLQFMRRKHLEFTADWQSQPADSDEFLDLLGEHGDQMQLKALHRCMERLSEEQRVCISEFFLADKSYTEIAEQRGYQLKGVKSYIQNGKRNLKLCIENTTKEWGCCPI
ncbi:MAG: sigma-70 family RNA polymerase sigma factor [Alistipes sp.]|nr:sigma-70 family RNA polymerase sigma factor [Alistipes sp.]